MLINIKHWQDSVTLVLGVWTVASPWLLGFQTDATAMGNAVVIGGLIAAIGLIAVFRPLFWEEWANLVLGVWLVISPWALEFTGIQQALVSAVVVGGGVLALTLWNMATDAEFRDWWKQSAH